MMFEIHRTRFLKASELLNELIVLQQIKNGQSFASVLMAQGGLTDAAVRSEVARLHGDCLLESKQVDGETVLVLNSAGEQQLRILKVDYMRELILLHGEMIGTFRKKLAEFYLTGVRRVAFYPIGDTAEVVYLALQSSGLSLELAVDDDPLQWGAEFHGQSIKAPSALVDATVDGVILTTSVFEPAIRRRVEAMGAVKSKLLSLW